MKAGPASTKKSRPTFLVAAAKKEHVGAAPWPEKGGAPRGRRAVGKCGLSVGGRGKSPPANGPLKPPAGRCGAVRGEGEKGFLLLFADGEEGATEPGAPFASGAAGGFPKRGHSVNLARRMQDRQDGKAAQNFPAKEGRWTNVCGFPRQRPALRCMMAVR